MKDGLWQMLMRTSRAKTVVAPYGMTQFNTGAPALSSDGY